MTVWANASRALMLNHEMISSRILMPIFVLPGVFDATSKFLARFSITSQFAAYFVSIIVFAVTTLLFFILFQLLRFGTRIRDRRRVTWAKIFGRDIRRANREWLEHLRQVLYAPDTTKLLGDLPPWKSQPHFYPNWFPTYLASMAFSAFIFVSVLPVFLFMRMITSWFGYFWYMLNNLVWIGVLYKCVRRNFSSASDRIQAYVLGPIVDSRKTLRTRVQASAVALVVIACAIVCLIRLKSNIKPALDDNPFVLAQREMEKRRSPLV